MTLQEAFNGWSSVPRNTVLANKYRDAINKVLMKDHANTDLSRFTEPFTVKLFSGSDSMQEYKTKAASILVYLLQWGADRGYCKRPAFDYRIGSAKPAKPVVKRFRTIVPYAQIDPNTLQVIKIWPSMREAMRTLGVKNLDRCAQNFGTSGGYYWSLAADADTFPDRLAAKKGARQNQSPLAL